MVNLIDQEFGRLTVKERAESDDHRRHRWLCQCSCGNYKIIRGDCLLSGDTKSCGCLVHDWKGTGRMSIHRRVARDKPKPKLCERCRENPAVELSYDHSLSKEQRSNPDAYEWLCRSCHNFRDRGDGIIITKAHADKIRGLYTFGTANQYELAKLFKVSRVTIHNIVNYKGAYQKLINPDIFKELVKSLSETKGVNCYG